MKILQVFNQYRFRGGEEAWVNGIADLLAEKAEVDELRFSSKDWIGNNSPSPLQQIHLMGDNPASRAALRERVNTFHPDILLFHNVIPVGSFGLYQEVKSLGIPILQYTHNFRPFSPGGTLWLDNKVNDSALRGNPWPEILGGAWQGSRLKTAILAYHLQCARSKGLLDCIDHWLAISNFMRDKFMEAGIPDHKITVLRHCWETPASPPPSNEQDHYLFLGRLVAEKGASSLVDAWQILEKELGDSCPKLILAGDGPLEGALRRRTESMRKVECVGFVDGETKTDLIRTCRALMVPSIWWEPLGLTTYEAYAQQRPVIASRSGALQETVQDQITGWQHTPSDAQNIADAVMKAEAADTSGRLQLGKAGHQWLIQNASPEQWRTNFLQICMNTIGSINEAPRTTNEEHFS